MNVFSILVGEDLRPSLGWRVGHIHPPHTSGIFLYDQLVVFIDCDASPEDIGKASPGDGLKVVGSIAVVNCFQFCNLAVSETA